MVIMPMRRGNEDDLAVEVHAKVAQITKCGNFIMIVDT